MKQIENIISIRKRDISEANKAFDDFMRKTEDCFNQRSINNPTLYKNVSPSDLEKLAEQTMKEVSSSTPFRKEEIKLVAGHSFPDIISEKYFGVEVKSTKDDKWTSTGSSIVESTRNEFVENIYMFFGKLGGTPPQFRCRSYEDCLSNIAVTHSPRYMIDMELRDKNEPTIFDKMEVHYDDFRERDEKIDIIRNFYIKRAIREGKHEMPWWVGKQTIESEDNSEVPAIRLFNYISTEEKRNLKAQMAILFPQVILGDYNDAALWLCTHRYLLCMNTRDFFSAGGQMKFLNGKRLETPYPAVLKKLMDVMPYVKYNLLNNNDLEYFEFNTQLFSSKNRLRTWLLQAKEMFDQYEYEYNHTRIQFSSLNIDVVDYLENPQKYVLKTKE